MTTPPAESTEPRHCVACGYNLFGLGEEPRCPECGLVNIPQALREQVWELVDSGTWFFSGCFHPFRRRLPGWWWALDRPGDLRRSIRFAVGCTLVTAAILFVVTTLDDSVRLRTTYTWAVPIDRDKSEFEIREQHMEIGFASGIRELTEPTARTVSPEAAAGLRFGGATNTLHWRLSLDSLDMFLHVFVLLLALWAAPATVGFWTQIRKGLPSFARAPRTIIAASMYESHRLLYLAAIVATWCVVDVVVRARVSQTWPMGVTAMVMPPALFLSVGLIGAAGWIGPARSDYTRQLVRSRFHAARIVVMYAVILPWMALLAVGAATP